MIVTDVSRHLKRPYTFFVSVIKVRGSLVCSPFLYVVVPKHMLDLMAVQRSGGTKSALNW